MTKDQRDDIARALEHFRERSSEFVPGVFSGYGIGYGIVIHKWAYILLKRLYWARVKVEIKLSDDLVFSSDGSPFDRGVVEHDDGWVWLKFPDTDTVRLFYKQAKSIVESFLFLADGYKRIPFSAWVEEEEPRKE